MGAFRAAAQSVFGDRIPSDEERALRRQLRQLDCRTKCCGGRRSRATAAASMANQQVLQTSLAYESIREQRFRRLADMYAAKGRRYRADKCLGRAEAGRLAIMQLQQQMCAYQPQPQQPLYVTAEPPAYSAYPVLHPYTLLQQQQQQQQQQWQAVAAVPVAASLPSAATQSDAPPPYSGPAFAYYPIVHSSATSQFTSPPSYSFFSESCSSRGQLTEPWLHLRKGETLQ